MANFVELWVYLASAPLFGLTATLAVYVLAQALSVRSGHAPWANPVMVSVAILASVMLATGTAYPTYFAGAQFIHFLLGPAVVALGWPLWQRRAALRSRWARLVLASLAGGFIVKYAVVMAGHASADDPAATFEFAGGQLPANLAPDQHASAGDRRP